MKRLRDFVFVFIFTVLSFSIYSEIEQIDKNHIENTTSQNIDRDSMQEMTDRILHEFFQAPNRRDFSFIPKLYSPDAIIHSLDGDQYGPEVILNIFNKWMHAFPDFQFEPLVTRQEKDVVIVHWCANGTFTHKVRDIPPTGKKIIIHGFTCFKCSGDQIIEHWARVDYRPLTNE